MQQHIATTRSIEQEQAPALTIGLDIGDRHTHICVLGPAAEIVSEQRVRTAVDTLTHALGELPGVTGGAGGRATLSLGEPAGDAHVRICPGGGRQRPSLPGLLPVARM